MIHIIPAVLPESFEELERGLERLRGISPLIQIDLVGENVLAGKEELPHWEEFDFEIDIMLSNPLHEVQACIDVGASRIIVHARTQSAFDALELLQDLRGGDYPLEAGLALAAHDEPQVLEGFEGLYDYVQVMGIDNIGKQGEPPDPHHKEIDLIKKLRVKFPELVIQVDGGVAPHVRELVAAGANRLVVGSAIIRAENPKEVYKALYTEANAGRE